MKDKKDGFGNWVNFLWPLIILGLFFLARPYIQKSGGGVGEKLYTTHCLNCHQEDGKGVRGLVPPLANSDYLTQYQQELPCLIRNGKSGEIFVNGRSFNHPMPPNRVLTDAQIYNIIRYINQLWKFTDQEMNLTEVKTILETCASELPKQKPDL